MMMMMTSFMNDVVLHNIEIFTKNKIKRLKTDRYRQRQKTAYLMRTYSSNGRHRFTSVSYWIRDIWAPQCIKFSYFFVQNDKTVSSKCKICIM